MYDFPHNFEQASLIGMVHNSASEKVRLTPAGQIGRSETAGSDAKHGQVWLAVTDCDCLGIRCQNPVSKCNKTRSLINLLSYDSCVDHRVMESEPIKPQIHEQLVHYMS
jgi:hypothetical protein